MQLTKKSRYAVLAYLACSEETAINAGSLAEKIGAPKGVARQTLVQLAGAGWLKAARGRSGGYTRNPAGAGPTLRDILLVFEGPIDQTFCRSNANCNAGSRCDHHVMWEQLSRRFDAFLGMLHLDDLAHGGGTQAVRVLDSAASLQS